MPDNWYPVQRAGGQAVVTLPENIDSSNADQVREQLLWVINRGATVLIADLTGTISCDYSGADALARAYHRAVANGTQLRLVVISDMVRRVLSINGLDRLAPVYPTLDGAVAAGGECREVQGEPKTAVIADHAARGGELLDSVVTSIFNVSMILQAAAGQPDEVTVRRIAEARRRLDDVVGRSVITSSPGAARRSGPTSLAGPRRPSWSVRRSPRIARRCCVSVWRRRPIHCSSPRPIPPRC
jgi:anti-sigma B factor antagonist